MTQHPPPENSSNKPINDPVNDPQVLLPASRPRKIKRWLYGALFVIVLAAVGYAIAQQLAAVEWSTLRLQWPLIAAAACLMLLSKVLSLGAFRAMLRPFCPDVHWRLLVVATWLPQLGKYIPGKVATVAGMVWLLRRYGLGVESAAAAAVLISALSALVGLMLSMPMTLMEPIRSLWPQAYIFGTAMLIVALICLHPKVLKALLNFLLGLLRRPVIKVTPRPGDFFEGIAYNLLQWILVGLALWLVAAGIALPGRERVELLIGQAPLFVASSSLAATIGFLAVFAPAGIGVREGILLVVLGPVIGPEVTALAVLATRLLQTVIDLLTGAFGAMFMRKV